MAVRRDASFTDRKPAPSPPRSSGLRWRLCRSLGRGRRRLDRLQINLEERFQLVALLLVLLAHPDHLAKNLDVEAVPLGLEIDFLLGFGELLDLLVDVLDPLDNGAQLIARNIAWSAHWLYPLELHTPSRSVIQAIA